MTRTAPDPLVRRAQLDPDGPALRAGPLRWSNRRLLEVVDGLALALAEVGVAPGRRVACLFDDDVGAVSLIHAVRRAGAVLVPLNRRATPADLRYQIEVADVASIITDPRHASGAAEAAGASRSLHLVGDLLGSGSTAPRHQLRAEVDRDAPATIVFTSGTTGRPKGAVLTHGNHAASADAWAAVLRPAPGDRWLGCLPLFHVAGLAVLTRALRWGTELEIHPRFAPRAVADAIEVGVTHLSLVAAQLTQLLDEASAPPVPATLRALLLGGGPAPPTLLARAQAAGYPVFTTYGMTETASGIAVGGLDVETTGDPTALRPLPGVDVRIGMDDEILVRGPMVVSGYLAAPDATAAAVRDGWLHTGDTGSIDADGLLHIGDRRDDLIISGGENVYPAEIEAVLRRHPGVVEAAVTAQQDVRWGTVPIAFIVPAPGARPQADDLASLCRQELASFKVPVGFSIVAALPRDGLGKVRRRALAAGTGKDRRADDG